MRLVQRAGDKNWEWAACVWKVSQGTANMGRKALNYRQGRKSMKRIQQKACEVCLYLIWLLLTGSPKEQLFIFLQYGSLNKRTSKTWDNSLTCPQPAGKLSWFEKLARSHAWAARERSESLRLSLARSLEVWNGELARQLTYPTISFLLDSFCTITKTIPDRVSVHTQEQWFRHNTFRCSCYTTG